MMHERIHTGRHILQFFIRNMKRMPVSRFLAQCCEEPFRLFFPLGLAIGLLGVSLWPLYLSGIDPVYPGIMHARLMVEGFLGAFVFGFLGTAGPRLTSTRHLTATELILLLAMFLAANALQIVGFSIAGDAVFLVLLVTFVARMGWRFVQATELPPPGFVLVAAGLASAIAGIVLILLGAAGTPHCAIPGRAFFNELFILFPVLGIGSFLLPRFLDLPFKQPGKTSWRREAITAGTVAILISCTFVAEIFDAPQRWTSLVRFLVTLTFVGLQIRLHRGSIPRTTLPQCLRLSVMLVLAGMLCEVFWPGQRIAALHVVFIGGFSLVTFTVATRVVLGHGGFGHLFGNLLPSVLGMALLLLPAMGLRFIGDFASEQRSTLLTYAGLLWIAGALLWALFVLPKILCVEAEEIAG